MSGVGFSLKLLLGVIALIALGCVALHNASRSWVAIIGLATCFLLFTSLLAILLLRGRQRAFWIGFAVFGWGYIALAYGPESYDDVVPTTYLLRDLGQRLRRTVPISNDPPQWVVTTAVENNQRVAVVVDPRNVTRVGKLLFTWLFGVVGAFIGAFFHDRRTLDDHEPSPRQRES